MPPILGFGFSVWRVASVGQVRELSSKDEDENVALNFSLKKQDYGFLLVSLLAKLVLQTSSRGCLWPSAQRILPRSHATRRDYSLIAEVAEKRVDDLLP